MVANKILRENARNQLGNRIFGTKWMTMLVVCCMLSFISAASAALNFVGAVAMIVVSGPILYGTARTTVECVEGDKWDIGHTFRGFNECFGRSVLLWFLQGLFTALWSLLLIIPGIVKGYSYAMAFYIQQEKGGNGREPVDCITQSRRMMDGHKWQLFCLDLSFLGWYILGALCLGVGVFFVIPYHEMARANFYEALKAELGEIAVSTNAEEPEQLTIEENTNEEDSDV